MSEASQPHSVWLMPESKMEAQFSALNAELSAAGAGPVFAPHLTLAGDLSGVPDQSAQTCSEVFANTGEISGRINAVQTGPDYFMALYFEVALPEVALSRYAELVARLGTPSKAGFCPHISLAYGPKAPALLGQFEAQIEGLVGIQVIFDHLAIARSAKSIPERDWTVLQKIYP